MELRFAESESTFSYFEALRAYLKCHGKPVALYSDKASVFRQSEDRLGRRGCRGGRQDRKAVVSNRRVFRSCARGRYRHGKPRCARAGPRARVGSFLSWPT